MLCNLLTKVFSLDTSAAPSGQERDWHPSSGWQCAALCLSTFSTPHFWKLLLSNIYWSSQVSLPRAFIAICGQVQSRKTFELPNTCGQDSVYLLSRFYQRHMQQLLVFFNKLSQLKRDSCNELSMTLKSKTIKVTRKKVKASLYQQSD